MWIVNQLPLFVTQTMHHSDNLIFVSTETLDVECGVGSLKLDTGRSDRPRDGVGNWKTEITTEGQGHLDELAADGKTSPKAAMPGGSTFRIKCGDDGFHQDSLDVPHQSCLHRARTKKPRASCIADFTGMSSVLNEFSVAPSDCPLHTEGSRVECRLRRATRAA